MDSGVSLATYARALADDLAAGRTYEDTIRVIIQASDDVARLDPVAAWAFLVDEPPSTGDRRYDALLAGLAVHLCRVAGLGTTPDWTRAASRFLDRVWWFGIAGDVPSLQALTFQRTPSCLRSRGVMFNVDNLASI